MALITCPDCTSEMSDAAISCPRCGRPNERVAPLAGASPNPGVAATAKPNDVPVAPNSKNFQPPKERSVGFWLGVGIFLLPIVFAWLTLQKGYSAIARIIAFMWLAAFVMHFINSDKTSTPAPAASPSPAQRATEPEAPRYATSTATYTQVDAEVGCKSKYSDDKKDDIFKTRFKDHWMIWRGQIVLAEADNASLDIDGIGTQDLQVNFANPREGYDLTKGNKITVKFLLKSAGGCFLPFRGKEAVIVTQ